MSNEIGKAMSDDAEEVEIDDDEDLIDDDEDIVDDDDDFSDTVILSEADSDDDDDETSTAEINVERLMAELEKSNDQQDAARRKEIRRRLEELAEEKSFEDTYAIDFDES
jgi:hypothetical protein